MNKILVVKTSALGDILHVFPAIRFLAEIYPQAQIDWVVEKPFASLVERNPWVHNVITIDTKAWRKNISYQSFSQIKDTFRTLREKEYDLLIDFQGNLKSGIITGCARAGCKTGFGKNTAAERPNTWFTDKRFDPPKGQNIREDYLSLAAFAIGKEKSIEEKKTLLSLNNEEKERLEQLLSQNKKPGFSPIMVALGSRWPNKQISDETLACFLQKIEKKQKAQFWFIYGSEEEKARSEMMQKQLLETVLVEKLCFAPLQNLMNEMNLVIAMDSLPLHLAGETETPTFSVFGASSSTKYKPLGLIHQAYQGSCPYGKNFEKRCPILRTCPTGACIHDINADILFQTFKNLKLR